MFNVKAHLLNGALGLEENAPPEQLSKDAAHGPDVDGVGVMAAPHEDLRSPVILCHNFLSHVPRLVRLLHPGQAKVTDLEDSESDCITVRLSHGPDLRCFIHSDSRGWDWAPGSSD